MTRLPFNPPGRAYSSADANPHDEESHRSSPCAAAKAMRGMTALERTEYLREAATAENERIANLTLCPCGRVSARADEPCSACSNGGGS